MTDEVGATDDEVYAFPASFAQQRLWFLDQVDPLMAVYNVPLGVRVTGSLDVSVLDRCLQEIVRRHESLRTTFVGQEGVPLQLVAPPGVAAVLRVVDLRARADVAPTDREGEALRLASAEAQTPFDLAKGPLFRVLAVVVDDASHVLVFNAHHVICDGSSLTLLLGELSALYAAFSKGAPSPLPEPTTQYADFALWQRECFEGDALEPKLSFWRQSLAGPHPVLALPAERKRPATQSFDGASIRFVVSSELTSKLGKLARQEGASLFMLLLTAFHVLLSRLSGQDEVLVGTPIANRERAEVATSIGFYTNTVVFRADVGAGGEAGGRAFRDLLRDVRKNTMDVLAHQDVPFEKVVEAVRPVRSTSHNPLFQAMFGLQRAPEGALSLPGTTITSIDIHCGMSKFDLTLDMQEIETGMQGLLEYSTELFDRETVEAFARHWLTLLEAIAKAPDAPVRRLELLDATERSAILTAPNATATSFAAGLCLHDLVVAQAARSPVAVAVEHDGSALTYAELDRRSTELAHVLREVGVGPDVPVAICMSRSPDLIVALVAVLKAGGAYLPLDPAYPVDRLAYMLEDSGARVVLTEADLREDLPLAGSSRHVILIGADEPLARPTSAPSLPADVTPDHRAYVIYTSGSMGKPKGVEIPHRAVVNFLQSMALSPGLTSADRLLAVTTLSFDIAVLELFLPLTVGATIVLASRDTATDGQALLELLVGSRATVLQATPSTYRMLLEAGWEVATDGSAPLRLLCGGEALPPGLASSLLERSTELWNMYGPTETTVWSTCKRIEDPDAIAIGRPIANTRVYVLDGNAEPVPAGVLGELYIGGTGVALGYLGRPELTQERFVPDPFSEVGGLKLYRTGDLARLGRDGEVHFVGRGDTQVKVRGFRIELGEIETVLGRHEELRQVVVVVREDATGDARIVAYVVYELGASPTPSELRRHLRQSLPDHMIPHFFVDLPQLPQTQNGKVDRRALPDPFESERRAIEDIAPPTTEAEKAIAEIWRELLRVGSVGLHDNFFDLGGHSLLSMQAIHRTQVKTGHRLSPRSMVFDTLSQLAAECESRSSIAVAGLPRDVLGGPGAR